MFKYLTNLQEINLKSNRITSFNRFSFANFVRLEIVCIFDNPISSIYPSLLENNICIGNSKCNVYTL